MLDGERLHDHSAERRTHHDGPIDSGRVEHRDRVVGHVRQTVAIGAVVGQPDVTVVETNHPKAPASERLAHLPAVGDALIAESVHEEQDRSIDRSGHVLPVQTQRTIASGAHACPPGLATR